jgi:glyoxylase-like metal-dependent hydrolase (beta-lactamase superfamily II)
MGLPIAGTWFEINRISDDISLIFEPHVVPLLRCNIWHVRGRDRDLMIDTGMGIQSLRTFAKDFLDKRVTAVATHVHLDHIGSHHEFDECLVHGLECNGLTHPSRAFNLVDEQFDPNDIASIGLPPIEDYDVRGPMLTAVPHADYDLASYRIRPARNVRTIDDGDVLDLGDRSFEVLHLPGHSPGGIGLWESSTGALFSGDAIYDGPLLDTLHHSDTAQYARTFERLQQLPIQIVHAGHDPSFGRDRLLAITASYLEKWATRSGG